MFTSLHTDSRTLRYCTRRLGDGNDVDVVSFGTQTDNGSAGDRAFERNETKLGRDDGCTLIHY